MRPLDELLQFLNSKMSMTEIYQPVIIRYLLEQDGIATKTELAQVISGYDDSVQEYYQKVLMRYPKATLTKHEIISYSKEDKAFLLNFELNSEQDLQKAKAICEKKILNWIDKRSTGSASSSQLASKRYRILKAARGKCELCGISAKISPIDIDHIVPQNKADKHRKIVKDDISMHVDDERNLQALCFRCNRAKRDSDDTDFRMSSKKLVRDYIPDIIAADGRKAVTETLTGKRYSTALFEKLTEEHIELIADRSIEEVVDIIEVCLAIAQTLGYSEEETIELMKDKRQLKGGFKTGMFLKTIEG